MEVVIMGGTGIGISADEVWSYSVG